MNTSESWMSNALPVLGQRPLGDIALAGAHDAGMYALDLDRLQVSLRWKLALDPPWPLPEVRRERDYHDQTVADIASKLADDVGAAIKNNVPLAGPLLGDLVRALGTNAIKEQIVKNARAFAEDLAITQQLSIAEQLRSGVRWFDLRPKRLGSEGWWLHHSQDGLNGLSYKPHKDLTLEFDSVSATGPRLADVLKQVAEFLATHRELVILNISHVRASSFGPADFNDLAQEIGRHLGPWLYKGPVADGALALTPLSVFLTDGGRAVVLYDGKDYVPTPGIVPGDEARFRGGYKDTDVLETMQSDQMQQFRDFGGRADGTKDLFMLVWTLTVQSPTKQSVKELAKTAHAGFAGVRGELAARNTHGRLPNVVALDFVDADNGIVQSVVAMNGV